MLQTANNTNVFYACFVGACLLVYYKLEAPKNAEYDYMLTLSAGLQALGFFMLARDTSASAAEGLSEKMLWAFIIAHTTRLSTTFWGEGYIPEDNTGDVFLFQGLEASGVLLCVFQVMRLSAVRSTQDVGQGIERWHQVIAMCGVSAVLAYFTKSTGHDDYWADLSWMFATWLEAFALLPQVHLLFSGAGIVDEAAAHFAGLTLASSLVILAFWVRMTHDRYREYENEAGDHRFFIAVLVACGIRVALCGGYAYLFSKQTKNKANYELCAHDEL
eukprot:TRINITY_DN108394_c0_g1_i1.p1 TRINITY_DN108394_c0_g1~~TRINITY_DN108394_c0_g1_i1.p1  ORF type:complete len:274 (-),score=58.16 TRINITY_DN108394_c0_g1_i1:87-908(-)